MHPLLLYITFEDAYQSFQFHHIFGFSTYATLENAEIFPFWISNYTSKPAGIGLPLADPSKFILKDPSIGCFHESKLCGSAFEAHM